MSCTPNLPYWSFKCCRYNLGLFILQYQKQPMDVSGGISEKRANPSFLISHKPLPDGMIVCESLASLKWILQKNKYTVLCLMAWYRITVVGALWIFLDPALCITAGVSYNTVHQIYCVLNTFYTSFNCFEECLEKGVCSRWWDVKCGKFSNGMRHLIGTKCWCKLQMSPSLIPYLSTKYLKDSNSLQYKLNTWSSLTKPSTS